MHLFIVPLFTRELSPVFSGQEVGLGHRTDADKNRALCLFFVGRWLFAVETCCYAFAYVYVCFDTVTISYEMNVKLFNIYLRTFSFLPTPFSLSEMCTWLTRCLAGECLAISQDDRPPSNVQDDGRNIIYILHMSAWTSQCWNILTCIQIIFRQRTFLNVSH